MAGLSSRPGDDAGQLLVTGALVLAVLLVGFAAVLNAAVYTETLASRGGGPAQTADATAFAAAAGDGVAPLVVGVNERNDSSHATLHAALAEAVADWDAAAGAHAAADARHASVTLERTDNGTHVAQTDERNFTAADGRGNWTLTANASATRGLRINLTDVDALAEVGSDERPFAVVVDDGATTWRATVERDGGDVVVTVAVDGTTVTCPRASGSTVTIDVTNGSVGGEPCPALRFGDDVAGSYGIAYENATNVVGTYGLVVDDPAVARSPPPAYGDATTTPNATPAVYGATVTVDYEAPRTSYAATVRVVPGDDDA